MGFLEQLNNEIARMTIENFIALSLMFAVPFYFSRKAETLFFHLLYSALGLYMIFFTQDVRILNDPKLLVGLGLILPQLRFIVQFVKDSIFTIKMMSSNTYYFFVTIYYKILRFISWVEDVILMFKNFEFKRKEKTKREHKEETYQEYSQEQTYNETYDEKERYEYEKQSSSYEEKQTNYEEPKQEYGEFERFYNSSAYIVLGVSENDDFKDIKKAYRKLVRIYHPDLNPDDIQRMTEITQLINEAYEKLEKYHK